MYVCTLLQTQHYVNPFRSTGWGHNTDLPLNSNILTTVYLFKFTERVFDKLSNDTQADTLCICGSLVIRCLNIS